MQVSLQESSKFVLVNETLATFFGRFGYSMEKNEWMEDKANIVLCAHNICEGLHSTHAFLKSEKSCQSTSAKAKPGVDLDDAADPEHGDDGTCVEIFNMDVIRPSSSVIPTEMVPIRTIPNSFPRKPYVARGQHKDNSKHWGQRKLLFTEIEFLTLHCQANCTVVYAGSAPGNIMLSISLHIFAHRLCSAFNRSSHLVHGRNTVSNPRLHTHRSSAFCPQANAPNPNYSGVWEENALFYSQMLLLLLLLSVSLSALYRNCSPTSSRKSSTLPISRTVSFLSVTFVGLMLVKKPF
jgi:hypothetical protein